MVDMFQARLEDLQKQKVKARYDPDSRLELINTYWA